MMANKVQCMQFVETGILPITKNKSNFKNFEKIINNHNYH